MLQQNNSKMKDKMAIVTSGFPGILFYSFILNFGERLGE